MKPVFTIGFILTLKIMKTLNKEELMAVAADIFGRYPKAEKVAVTSDGMAFITDEGENAVQNHSKRNTSGKELKITPFTRGEVVLKVGESKKTAEPKKGTEPKKEADQKKVDESKDADTKKDVKKADEPKNDK